jgi:hypothetical protein
MQQPIVMIVSGSTDATGSAAGNLRLSQRRAENVLHGLVARGIPIERFQVLSKGETEPVVPSKPGVAEERRDYLALTLHYIRARAYRAAACALLAFLIVLTGPLARGYEAAQDAAERSLSSESGRSAYAAGRFTDALRIWRPLAEGGDPSAAYCLGLLYDLG